MRRACAPARPARARRAAGGGVRGLVGALALLLGEGRLVDEQVGLVRDLEHARGRRVAGDDDLPPGPRRAEHLLRADTSAPPGARRPPRLEAAEERPSGTPSAARPRRRSGPGRGARRRRSRSPATPWAHRRRRSGSRPGRGRRRPAARRARAVGELPEDPLQAAEQVHQPRRPVDRERDLAAAERERLQHPGQAEVVVGVVVGEEDLGQLDQPDGRAQKLALGASPQSTRIRSPPRRTSVAREPAPAGRDRAGRPEEDEVEIHAPV